MNSKKISIILIVVLSACIVLWMRLYNDSDRGNNKNALESITQGDFSVIQKLDEKQAEELAFIYERNQDRAQWVYADLNKDGNQELIWQEKDCVQDSRVHRIIGIFSVMPDGCGRILWDVNDMTEFYFYNGGKIIYYTYWQGTYDCYSYGVCEYNADWEPETNNTFEIYDFSDTEDYDVEEFLTQFDGTGNGEGAADEEAMIYYVAGTRDTDGEYTRVLLPKEEWLEQFRQLADISLETDDHTYGAAPPLRQGPVSKQ